MAETSTKQFVEIQEIRDEILILKDGSLRQIIKVGSTNFELKSQDEQLAILAGFRNFLNALDFSLEIMVMSRKLNIGKYLEFLDQVAEAQQNELMRIQAVEYSRFVKELTQLANIMAKDFFVVIPFYIGPRTKGGIIQSLKNIFKPAQIVKQLTAEEFDSYKSQLSQRVSLVYENLAGLGLGAKILQQDELVNLYYRFYNQEAVEGITKANI
ncbi:MAG: hypothetical protein AAB338_02515 [Patescibacteria group bacterium]